MDSPVRSSPPAIRVTGLVKSFGTAAAPVHALRGVSLEIRRGERIALLGKSGSGKSTLLNLIAGLDRATAGNVLVEGQDLHRMHSGELARFRCRVVGMIFQSFNLLPSRTALENVELPMIFAGRPPGQRRAEARKALEALGLGQRLKHRPTELSGGEMQRVAIARALVNQPAVLLADEPTGNLDSSTANDIMTLITEHIRAHDTTLVLVTHDEELAGNYTDRILRLRDGQLL